MHPIHVLGMGFEGPAGLPPSARERLKQATVIAGSDRQLALIGDHPAQKLVLGSDFHSWLAALKRVWQTQGVVVLTSGDPLFFGIGRLLVAHFPPEVLFFHPHVSAVQLAFSRLRLPWQDATVVSVHGRNPARLDEALRQGKSPIAILTDGVYTPGAIAQHIQHLRLPTSYRLWVCSELGSAQERVAGYSLAAASSQTFPSPNVVVLEREDCPPATLPLLGIADHAFHTFPDRPGLITKQEVRILSLGLLELAPKLTVWDIGAGTGSISVEIARLVPTVTIFAIEKTALGVSLIHQNCQRFQVQNVQVIEGTAPAALTDLPAPDRIVVGGGGRNIAAILEVCCQRLGPGGVLVGNFATLEACLMAQNTLRAKCWPVELLQVNLARSTAIPTGETPLTRFVPLNPVILLKARKDCRSGSQDPVARTEA